MRFYLYLYMRGFSGETLKRFQLILYLYAYIIYIYVSPNSLLLGVLSSFLRCVRPLCHCWCPPFPAGHVAFLFICLPGLSLLVSALFAVYCLVSALFRWPCSISIHSSPRSVTAGWCPPFSAGHVAFLHTHLSPKSVTVGVCPFPLAM